VKTYKRPDLNAPRYRSKKLNFTNLEFYDRFIKENPKYDSVTMDKFKEVITVFNGKLWETAVKERDGIELPEQLGNLFIGSCPRKKRHNTNYKLSNELGSLVQCQNWESDNYVAKILYTNYETKYRFKNNEMWSFTGIRDFKRTVAKTYPENWKKYILLDNMIKVSRVFRKQKVQDSIKNETEVLLNQYDEFNLD
jgi:hypothetical protein